MKGGTGQFSAQKPSPLERCCPPDTRQSRKAEGAARSKPCTPADPGQACGSESGRPGNVLGRPGNSEAHQYLGPPSSMLVRRRGVEPSFPPSFLLSLPPSLPPLLPPPREGLWGGREGDKPTPANPRAQRSGKRHVPSPPAAADVAEQEAIPLFNDARLREVDAIGHALYGTVAALRLALVHRRRLREYTQRERWGGGGEKPSKTRRHVEDRSAWDRSGTALSACPPSGCVWPRERVQQKKKLRKDSKTRLIWVVRRELWGAGGCACTQRPGWPGGGIY